MIAIEFVRKPSYSTEVTSGPAEVQTGHSHVIQEDNMPPRKRSRRGGKPASTAVNPRDDLRNVSGGTANLDQLITWIEDFDMQFEARCALIDKLFEKKLNALEHHYAVECLKIPPEILKSKFILPAKGKENSDSTTVMEGTVQEADSTLHSRHRKRSRSAKVTSTFLTGSRMATRSSSLTGRNRMPKPMTSTAKGIFRTPALKSTFASAPSLITPKVQPDVPLSMVRHPRQGELAFSTSGSPLVVTSTVYEQRANVNLRLADGRVVSILPEPSLWPRDVPQVDEETRQELLNLRNHMDRFINQP